MKKFAIFVVFVLLGTAGAEADPGPDPIPAPRPDPEHIKPNALPYNPRQERYRGGNQQQQQQFPPQQPQYPPPQQQYPPQQPYPQQQNPYQQQPYYPYPPQQQQPGRRGRVLNHPSDLNAVQPPPSLFTDPGSGNGGNSISSGGSGDNKYNKRYPLTPPVLKFKIGIVSDLDQGSKVDGTDGKAAEFQSILRGGYLYLTQNDDEPSESNVTIEWNDAETRQIKGSYSYAGRGMELSTLNAFEGKVYSCDDSTGLVYEIPLSGNATEPITPIPWVLLINGNSTEPNGFKCEWATLKNGDLWIGGQGINKVDEKGEVKDQNQKYVKRVSPAGEVTNLDWAKNYEKVAKALEIEDPGYVTHEAVAWSDDLLRWMFIPKKISTEVYTEAGDAEKSSNAILIADENFDDIQVGYIGELEPERGFSGLKFIPGTQDQIVLALKVKKANSGDESYIMAFDLKGNMLLNETKFADQKYQGIEFL